MFPEPTSAAFATAAALGYDGVEVMVWTDAVSQDAGALRGLSGHYRMPVRSVVSANTVCGSSPETKVFEQTL